MVVDYAASEKYLRGEWGTRLIPEIPSVAHFTLALSMAALSLSGHQDLWDLWDSATEEPISWRASACADYCIHSQNVVSTVTQPVF